MDWINDFLDANETLPSSRLFLRWSAISAVAATLQRRVWMQGRLITFPNLYIFLVGPPGAGKTVAVTPSSRLVFALNKDEELNPGGVPNWHIASDQLTRASFADSLEDAKAAYTTPPPSETKEYNSIYICARELGVLFNEGYSNDFISVLTDLYDGEGFSERKRTSGRTINIERPQVNLIGATTPAHLAGFLPDSAWEGGFMSRTIVVYAGGEDEHPNPFIESRDRHQELLAGLRKIASLQGEMKYDYRFTQAFWDNWLKDGGQPAPEHPRMSSYLRRRAIHTMKLSMIAAASEGTLALVPEHFYRARDWLLEAEAQLNDFFLALQSGGNEAIVQELYMLVAKLVRERRRQIGEDSKKNPGVPESNILAYLQKRLPTHEVQKFWRLLINRQHFIPIDVDGNRCWEANLENPVGEGGVL